MSEKTLAGVALFHLRTSDYVENDAKKVLNKPILAFMESEIG
jgi:hypothetical protein